MRGRKVDLFLGGPLGLWVLDNVDPRTVGFVCTHDEVIAHKATSLGIYDNQRCKADVGLSVHYPRLLGKSDIDQYEHIYNIHPGLLPWGRCYYPVFWALWADEPAGCTLHEIDAGIDTGPIVDQRDVPKYNWDTGGTLHQRVSDAEKGLFLEYWPRIVVGDMPPAIPQPAGGSFHLKQEFFELKEPVRMRGLSFDEFLALDDKEPLPFKNITELLTLILCLSHPDYSGMIVMVGGKYGKKYEISMRPVE